MEIFIINLKRSADRKAHMLRQIENLCGGKPSTTKNTKTSFTFFNAIDSKSSEFGEYKKRFNPYLCYLTHGRVMVDNEIACYASHFKLWEKCAELNEPIVILEDDIILESNFFAALKEIEDSHFALVRGYFIDKSRAKSLRQIQDSHFYYTLKNLGGMQGYYITPDAAREFIKFREWVEPVDVFLEFVSKHKIDNIIYQPFFVSESNLAQSSTINKNIDKNISLKYKILRPIYRTVVALKRFAFKILYTKPKIQKF